MKIFGAFLFGIALLPTVAFAEITDCKAIQDSTARLACFDKGSGDAKPPVVRRPKENVAKAIPITVDQSNLDHVFLEAGIKLTVEAISDPKGLSLLSGAKLPILLIWNGYLDRPTIYKLQQKLDIIGQARKAEFKTVIFSDTSRGLYIFDVTNAGQTCSRDLCF